MPNSESTLHSLKSALATRTALCIWGLADAAAFDVMTWSYIDMSSTHAYFPLRPRLYAGGVLLPACLTHHCSFTYNQPDSSILVLVSPTVVLQCTSGVMRNVVLVSSGNQTMFVGSHHDH